MGDEGFHGQAAEEDPHGGEQQAVQGEGGGQRESGVGAHGSEKARLHGVLYQDSRRRRGACSGAVCLIFPLPLRAREFAGIATVFGYFAVIFGPLPWVFRRLVFFAIGLAGIIFVLGLDRLLKLHSRTVKGQIAAVFGVLGLAVMNLMGGSSECD